MAAPRNGTARMKVEDGHELSGLEFEFEWSALLSRYVVDFDPGPELNIGLYSEDEFAATFDVVKG